MRMHRRAERAGALAMHHPDAVNAALLAGGEVIIQQPGDLRRAKGVQIQFARDRQVDWLVGIICGHSGILAVW